MIKIANNLTNLVIKQAAGITANDVVDMDSFGGRLADYLSAPQPGLGTWSARRAARSTALGESAGVDPSMSLRHPLTSRSLAAGLGALLGGGAMAATGANLGGTLIGGFGGGLVGALLEGNFRRNKMEEINKAVDAAKSLKPITEQSLGIGLFGGTYNKGRVEAEQIINSGGSKAKILQKLLNSANSQGAKGPVGVAAGDLSLSIGASLAGLPGLTFPAFALGQGALNNQEAEALRLGKSKKND